MSKYFKRAKPKTSSCRHKKNPNRKSVAGIAGSGINVFADLFHSCLSGLKTIGSSLFNMFAGTIASGIKFLFSLIIDSVFGLAKPSTDAKPYTSSTSKRSKRSEVNKKASLERDAAVEADFSSQALAYLKTLVGDLISQTLVHLSQGKEMTSAAAVLGKQHAKTMVEQVTSRLSKGLVAEVANYLATNPSAAPMRKLSAHLIHKASREIINGIESGDLLRKFSDALATPAVAPTRARPSFSTPRVLKPVPAEATEEVVTDAPAKGLETVAVDVMKKVATGLVKDAANSFVSGTADRVSRGCGWLYSGARRMISATYGAACSAASTAMAYATAPVEEPEVAVSRAPGEEVVTASAKP